MVRALTERRVEAGALDDFVIAIGLVAVLTMHCAKGTEFSRVVLAGIGKSSIPSAASVKSVPEEEKADALQRERSLLNVASSRARGELVVTWVGEQSDLHGVHGVEPAMGGN
ncbi:3'-5' exonuclease [Nakamurella multipartita]|uniref:3'-5' exonuclease n=1 Tax=Nakamurella multipartita TaxID=53461 RepID=UPI0038995331